ncbi:MAG: MFS transporter [Thermoflavifilum sp.]|nr:MFS transporter [Thermoflavifilum sp.]MCL6514077.1 MFS transporter [Alicyclobacillus sp.]
MSHPPHLAAQPSPGRPDEAYPADTRPALIHLLGLAGLSRNVGFAANKVFSAALLESFHASEAVIGLVLGLEGLFGLILNPLTGSLSDLTAQPGMRRKVYVLASLPLAALLWLWFFHAHSFAVAATALTLFYAVQQAGISPYHAWMPEIVSPPRWGVASGYLNLWWQLGNLLAFLVIPMVWTLSHPGGVWLTVALIALGGLVTGLAVPEGRGAITAGASALTGSARLRAYAALLRGPMLLYFGGQACAWLAFESIASFFTLFIVHVAHGQLLDSALAMSVFTAAAMVAAPLVGRLYRRYRPETVMIAVLAVFGLIALAGLFVRHMLWVYILVGVEGLFWSANLTVAYALAVDLLQRSAPDPETAARLRGGLYGMTNFVQSIGLMVAAPVAGAVIRAAGGNYAGMFIVCCAAAWLGAVLTALLRRQ